MSEPVGGPVEPASAPGPAKAPAKESALLKEVLGWGAVLLVGLVAFLATRPKPPPPGRVVQPNLGPLDGGAQAARGSLGVRLEKADGGLGVAEVFSGSNAERAGLLRGDVIVAVDGQPATESKVLLAAIGRTPTGGKLPLRVRREEGEVDVAVELLAEGAFEQALAARLADAAVQRLVALRRPDGLWPHYQDAARPSVAVTALVARALGAASGHRLGLDAQASAKAELARAQAADGGLSDPAERYPHRVYATALAVLALQGDATRAAERDRMVAWLQAAQVQEAHGYDPIDARYGGWSYYDAYESSRLRTDVSTLRFAVEALATAKLPDDAPVWDRARLWLDLTQNVGLVTRKDDPGRARERQLRDGGFAFTPRMSKAGGDAVDGSLAVFRSYGSATADGALALLALQGVDRSRERPPALSLPDEPAAALRWLATRWSLGKNPGFGEDPQGWSTGVHYYYLAALAQALHRAGVWTVVDAEGAEHTWAAELVRLLGTLHLRRGERFQNPSGLMHEDSEPVAASLALLALGAARERLALGGGARLEAGPPPPARPLDPVVQAPPRDAVERGQRTFQGAGCVGCHVDAVGAGGNGPSLQGVAERALLRWRSTEQAEAGLKAFLRAPDPNAALSRGPWPTRMPPVAPELVPDEKLADLVKFLLSRRAGLPVSEAR